MWLSHSRRYGDLKQALVPVETAKATPRLTVPFDPEEWLNDRKARMAQGLKRLAAVVPAEADEATGFTDAFAHLRMGAHQWGSLIVPGRSKTLMRA